jgi:hypothetical protein
MLAAVRTLEWDHMAPLWAASWCAASATVPTRETPRMLIALCQTPVEILRVVGRVRAMAAPQAAAWVPSPIAGESLS